MSKADTRAQILARLSCKEEAFWMRTAGDQGILGFGLRWAVLLLFAAYFFIPLLWLVLATSKAHRSFLS